MGNDNLKIRIDPNGNIHREIINPPKPVAEKANTLKKIRALLTSDMVGQKGR